MTEPVSETGGLVAALARAQAKFAPIGKDSDSPAFGGYKYADLAAVLEVVRPVLAAEGLALVQLVSENEHGTTLVTKLLHESGEIVSSMPMSMDGLSSQQIGSMMTYNRRYCALAICGVHPVDEDDDGAEASAAAPQARSAPRTQSGGRPATTKQISLAESLLKEVVNHLDRVEYITKHAGRNVPLEELYTFEASKLIDKLQDDKKAGRNSDGVVTPADGSEAF